MERHVKERLIGAAVLMAAAIILIPEMLSGPERRDTAPEAQVKMDAPLKTYTIDLQQQAKPTEAVIEERAPPPEETPAENEPTSQPPDEQTQVIPERSAAIAPTPTSPASAATTPAARASEPPVLSTPRAPTEQTTAASQPSVRQAPAAAQSTARSGWAVQLGSFSKEESARRLAEDTRRSGHETFVMPVRSGAATLYRVRVGPMSDRASAEAALAALKGKAPGAAVVAHP